jgi:hypothetical protein
MKIYEQQKSVKSVNKNITDNRQWKQPKCPTADE